MNERVAASRAERDHYAYQISHKTEPKNAINISYSADSINKCMQIASMLIN